MDVARVSAAAPSEALRGKGLRKRARCEPGPRAPASENLEPRVVDIADIQPYEHNPRRAPHGEYARIKASVRAEGLQQPLVVTMRPGEPDYRLHSGGNTRLAIVKELFAETGDAQFATIACWYRAWTDEADVVLAHLKENDLRGGPGHPTQLHAAWQAKSKRVHRTLQSNVSTRGARCLRVRIASPGPRDHASVDRRIQRGTPPRQPGTNTPSHVQTKNRDSQKLHYRTVSLTGKLTSRTRPAG